VEGWVSWELIPCVAAVEWSQGGLLQDLCLLMEAACSGQKPEHLWPMEVEYASVGISDSELAAWDVC